MQRNIFRAQCKMGELENLKNYMILNKNHIEMKGILTLSMFHDEDHIFLYYEAINKKLEITEILTGIIPYLKSWPGDKELRYFVPMMDIFHYSKILENDRWRDSLLHKQSWGRIARLKPEMISSYIYYHYQYQEEKVCDGDKYGLISLNENLIFFYMECPETKEEASYKGLLTTKNTPENWMEVMEPHFIYWDDVHEQEKIWKTLDVIVRIDKPIE